MCDDHAAVLSRRQFLGGTTAATLVVPAVSARRPPAPVPASVVPARRRARLIAADGLTGYSMALHVHSSFSEKSGSMDAQLAQSAQNLVDVLWWTEHDGRLNGLNYRNTVNFTSPDKPPQGQGGPWQWQPQQSGPAVAKAGGVGGGSLAVSVQSTGGGKTARYGFYAQAPGFDYQCSLSGQSLSFQVLVPGGWSRGYLEFLVTSSWHPAAGGRQAGLYTVSYRIKPGGTAGRAATGRQGVVHVPVPAGEWQQVTITPADDIAALWPGMAFAGGACDFGLWGITLSAVSTGDSVSGSFRCLTFDRTLSGELALDWQQDMMAAYAPAYPQVTQYQGLEVSQDPGDTHVNWIGGQVTVDSYEQMSPAGWQAWLAGTAIPQIHAAGGLASYNHPFGVGRQPLKTAAKQDALLAQVAAVLLGNNALGADLIEAGYVQRGGVDLDHHLGTWDVLSRNAMFKTGTAVNDDHYGQDWAGGSQTEGNNWVTSVWAPTCAQADLTAALAAGRAWGASLSAFPPGTGSLDLLVDGTCPMGSASLSALTTRQVTITAQGVPAGGTLQVLQGPVDYAGTADPVPDTTVIAAYSAADLAGWGGQVTVPADTTGECFVRVMVLDAAGAGIAASNPVWLLHNPPPGGIPEPRQAP